MRVSRWWPDRWPKPDSEAEAGIWEALENELRFEMDEYGLEKANHTFVHQIAHDDAHEVTVYDVILCPHEGGKEYKA